MKLDELAVTLRPLMVQDKEYDTIKEVPYRHRMRVSVLDIPQEIADDFRAESPGVVDVIVGMYSRKGVERIQFSAGNGSSDGFPIVSVPV